MTYSHAIPPPLVSARVLAKIALLPELQRSLYPEGFRRSPYRVLSYRSVVTFGGRAGERATVRRMQQVQFLQNGVQAVLDHVWGDGVPIASYDNSAGRLEESFVDRGKRHLVIGLKRRAQRHEVRTFSVERLAIAGFLGQEEWLETIIDHPTEFLSRKIVFPKGRPCLGAVLHAGAQRLVLPVRWGSDGRTRIRFQVYRPVENLSYLVRWRWE